jgi:hypothetical protein
VSEVLVILKEYVESLGLNKKTLTDKEILLLVNELREAEEFGLARLVSGFKKPEELWDYVELEEE